DLQREATLGQRRVRHFRAALVRDVADLADAHAGVQADGDRLTDVRADLEHGRAEAAVEDAAAVESRLRRDALYFRKTLLHFGVERGAVGVRIRRVRRLHGELADALQVVDDFVHRAFRG